jgi:hypothetical protein
MDFHFKIYKKNIKKIQKYFVAYISCIFNFQLRRICYLHYERLGFIIVI